MGFNHFKEFRVSRELRARHPRVKHKLNIFNGFLTTPQKIEKKIRTNEDYVNNYMIAVGIVLD
jgi:hypothetical protein